MTKPEILSQEPISMADLRDKLHMIKDRDGELNFRANKTEDYINQLTILDVKKSEELRKKIADLKLTRLKEEQIIKIVDLLPQTPEELKAVLQGYVITLPKDSLKKVTDLVLEYASDAKTAVEVAPVEAEVAEESAEEESEEGESKEEDSSEEAADTEEADDAKTDE